MYYSKSTGGFYSDEINGSRKLIVPDPEWVRPRIDIVLQPGESAQVGDQLLTNNSEEPVSCKGVPDMGAEAPVVDMDNPDCKIPADAKLITHEQRQALLEGQSQGKVIVGDAAGFPLLIAPPEPPRAELEGRAWGAIKAERDRRTQGGGYLAAGSWFHSDLFSRSQQIGLVMMGAGIPAGLKWKTMGGAFVTMTPALAQAVFAAAAAHDQAIFAAAEVHHAAMLASPAPALYDITAGWPAVYGE